MSSVPPLTAEQNAALNTPPQNRTPEQKAIVAKLDPKYTDPEMFVPLTAEQNAALALSEKDRTPEQQALVDKLTPKQRASYSGSVPFYEDSRAREAKTRYTHDHHAAHVIGTGDGVQTTFDLPFKNTNRASGYVNNTTVPVVLNFGTGPYEVDQLTFATAPAKGTEVGVKVDENASPFKVKTLTVEQKAALAVAPNKRTAEQKAIVSSIV